MSDRVAVVPVRQGRPGVGAVEAVAEAGGRAWVIGSGAAEAADALAAASRRLWVAELGAFAPGRWVEWLHPRLAAIGSILLPHSPDGRDLAPRLAAALGRPLVSSAVQIGPDHALVARHGGLVMDVVALEGSYVATLQIGARHGIGTHQGIGAGADDTAEHPAGDLAARVEIIPTGGPPITDAPVGALRDAPRDPELLGETEPDRATRDLAESTRIVAAGAGLGDRAELARLDVVAEELGASVGATRVVTDWGWLPADRQIGTTGVMVDPEFYLAVGISGAVQHTAGLGRPSHIVAVNTDPSCPMMELADLALVCDGPAYLRAMAAALGREPQPALAEGGDRPLVVQP